MQLKNIMRGFAFARNPIVIHIDAPAEGEVAHDGGSFSVAAGGGQPFEGVFYAPCDLNISDVVEGAVPAWPEIATPGGIGGVPLAGNAVTVTHSLSETERVEFVALPGGVSRQNFRKYAEGGTDAFAARFLNRKANFFLTVRSSDWRIPVRADELGPFHFVTDTPCSIMATDLDSGKSKTYGPVSGLCALDLERVYADLGKPELIDIRRDGKLACRFVIETPKPSLERFLIKFRNSLGVFELMMLTGTANIDRKWEGDDENGGFKQFDELVSDFVDSRLRMECVNTITIGTGYLSPERISLLADIVASDECYLLDSRSAGTVKSWVKVIPSVGSFKHQLRQTKPEKFDLELKVAEPETAFMPDILSALGSVRRGIFTDEFDGTFA